MRFVDHDPVATRATALRCRETAHEYVRVAAAVAADTAGLRWWGAERDRVLAEVEELADDLRREAAALRATAVDLEHAARSAERRDEQLQAATATALECAPLGPR